MQSCSRDACWIWVRVGSSVQKQQQQRTDEACNAKEAKWSRRSRCKTRLCFLSPRLVQFRVRGRQKSCLWSSVCDWIKIDCWIVLGAFTFPSCPLFRDSLSAVPAYHVVQRNTLLHVKIPTYPFFSLSIVYISAASGHVHFSPHSVFVAFARVLRWLFGLYMYANLF